MPPQISSSSKLGRTEPLMWAFNCVQIPLFPSREPRAEIGNLAFAHVIVSPCKLSPTYLVAERLNAIFKVWPAGGIDLAFRSQLRPLQSRLSAPQETQETHPI